MNNRPEVQPASDSPESRGRVAGRLMLLAIAVMALVIVALLFPIPFEGPAATAVGDLVHAPLFAGLALGWLWGWQRIGPLDRHDRSPAVQRAQRYQGRQLVVRGLVVWVVLSGFGVVMEILQGGMGRSMSRHDAIANAMGCAAAIPAYIACWFISQRRRLPALLFGCGAVAILTIAWIRPVSILVDLISASIRRTA